MTGEAEFPDVTGPSPLLIPATAMKTVGRLWPKNIYSLIGKFIKVINVSPQNIYLLIR